MSTQQYIQQLQKDKDTIILRLKFRKYSSERTEGLLNLLKNINKRLASVLEG